MMSSKEYATHAGRNPTPKGPNPTPTRRASKGCCRRLTQRSRVGSAIGLLAVLGFALCVVLFSQASTRRRLPDGDGEPSHCEENQSRQEGELPNLDGEYEDAYLEQDYPEQAKQKSDLEAPSKPKESAIPLKQLKTDASQRLIRELDAISSERLEEGKHDYERCQAQARTTVCMWTTMVGLYLISEGVTSFYDEFLNYSESDGFSETLYEMNILYIGVMSVFWALSPCVPVSFNVAEVLFVAYITFPLLVISATTGVSVGGCRGYKAANQKVIKYREKMNGKICSSENTNKCCKDCLARQCKHESDRCFRYICQCWCIPVKLLCCWPYECTAACLKWFSCCARPVEKCLETDWVRKCGRGTAKCTSSVMTCIGDTLCGKDFICLKYLFDCSKRGVWQNNCKTRIKCADAKWSKFGKCCGFIWCCRCGSYRLCCCENTKEYNETLECWSKCFKPTFICEPRCCKNPCGKDIILWVKYGKYLHEKMIEAKRHDLENPQEVD